MLGAMPLNLGIPSAELLRPSGSTRSVSNRPAGQEPVSAATRMAVSLEYASTRHHSHCPLGMYILPSVENLLVWDGVLFVHQGYYADAILKFRILFPSNYPNKQPSVQFVTDVFHPLIDSQTGTFSLAPRFKPWKPEEHHVFHVLHYIKAAFKKNLLDYFKESECHNKEAFRYHESISSFAALATQSSLLSNSASALFDSDHPSMTAKVSDGIKFKELTKTQLQDCRAALGLEEWVEDS